jgi:hypothetical protein
MIGVVAGMPGSGKMQRFSVWNRRDEVSGNMNNRTFWAWHGSIWHAPVAALVMPLSRDRLFPQKILPVRGDQAAQVPPPAILSITAKDTTIIKSLCRMSDAIPVTN